MGKKKKPEEGADNGAPGSGTAVMDPPAESPAPTQSNGPPAEGQAPPKNRPAASFAAYSDRTTRVEVAVWSKLVKVSDQEEYTQYALTLSRGWRDKDGHWQGNASFRVHDIPVLLYLVQQAYNWCVAQRTEVKIGDEPLPF